MASSNQHEEKIKQTLKNMPEISPGVDKDKLYQRISSQVDHSKKKKRFILIPAFSLTLIVLFAIIVTNLEGQIYNENSATEDTYDNSASSLQEESSSNGDSAAKESQLRSAAEQIDNRLIIKEIQENEIILYGNVTESQTGHTIPVSYVLPGGQTDAFYMDHIEVLEEKLSEMFHIDHFEIDLSKEKPRQSVENKVGYKIYQNPTDANKFLLPVPLKKKADFKSALDKMKNKDEKVNVAPSILNKLSFLVTELEGNVLQLNSNSQFENNQQYKNMIEAIIMAAESFGYSAVQFTGTTIKQIGPYQLNNPIQVPIGVNPIDLNAD